MLKKIYVPYLQDSKLLANSFFITISRIATYFLSLIFTMQNARYLGAEDYGKLTYIIAVGSIASIFFTMGMDVYIVIQLSRNKDKLNQCINANIVNRVFFICLTFLTLMIANFFIPVIEMDMAAVLVFMSIVFDSFRTIPLGCFQAMERMSNIAVSDILKLAVLNLVFLVMKSEGAGLIYAAFAYFISSLTAMIWSFHTLSEKFGFKVEPVDTPVLKSLIACSFPFFLNAMILMLASRADLIIIKHLMGNTETGYYFGAKRIFELTVVVPGIITTLLLPKLSKKNVPREKIQQMLKALFILGAVIGIITFAGSGMIIHIVLGNQFMEASKVLQVFSLSIPLVFMNFFYGTVLAAENKQKYMVVINTLGTIISIGFNLLVIPTAHANGAAAVSVAVSMLVFVMNHGWHKKLDRSKVIQYG